MSAQKPQSSKQSIKFSRALWLAMSSIAICLVGGYLVLGSYSQTDKMAYDKLVRGEEVDSSSTETRVSKQQRSEIQKNVLFNHNHQDLELRLTSQNSLLALEKTERNIEIVEHLQDVNCLLQESVYFVLPDGRQAFAQGDGRLLIKEADPKENDSWLFEEDARLIKEQILLVLKAENATYYYKGGKFVANQVSIQRYVVPGNHLEEIPTDAKRITNGVATQVKVSLGKGLDFSADNFKAKFSTQQGNK